MPKRKNLSGDDIDGDLTIPLPIQTFFWRQTRPFIRPKLEKLCEASCVSFERVVVQNILHGCSPSLCEAIQSVSRWKVIQAAFPHVMHACAALVEVCKYGHAEAKFGSCETKLLYILHWIILDAASECEDIESDPNRNTNNPPSVQLHSLSTVQLFVYLFAPLIELMEETDFHTLKLENGLRLWRPLWDFRQPDIPCFATPVKPQRNVLKAQRSLLKVNTNAANIYMGKGTSRDNLNNMAAEVSSRRGSLGDGYQSPQAPLARMSDICPVSTDTASVNVEVLCEHCNNVVPLKNGAEGGSGCNCTHRRESNMSYNFDSKLLAFHRLSSSIDRDYINKRLASAVTSGVKGPTAPDILSASYFDVAVLRCLFCQNWSEEGVHWALRYIQQRLLEICEEVIASDYRDRERSFSLPFPDLNLLTKDNNPAAMLDPSRKKAAAILTPSSTLTRRNGKCMSEGGHSSSHSPRLLSHSPTLPKPSAMFEELRKEPAFKRHRIYFDTARAQTKPGVTLKPGMNSRTINLKSPSKPEDPTAPAVSPTNDSDEVLLERGKSVKFPLSLKNITPFDQEKFKKSIKFSSGSEGGPESSSHESSSSSQPEDPPADVIQKPIITITEHHDHHRPRLCGTEKNHVSSRSQEIVDGNQNSTKSVGLSRSMTDTNIHYRHGEEVSEVSGSSHYITENGHINYHVVLKAVHFISASQHSERVCEVLLNILNCLLDLEIIQNPPKPSTPAPETKAADPVEPEKGPEMKPSPDDKEKEEMKAEAERSLRDDTAHGLAMDSVLNVFRSLGCPHGCGDGLKGSHGDLLRSKGHNCLQRLQKLNPSLFRTYFRDIIQKFPIQESMDFLHAFLGFCVEPSIILQTPSQASMTSGNFRKCSSQEFPQPCGFRNNFGHSISGEGYRGVEGVLIASIYKTFLTKCVEHSRELFGSDNIGLFCDVRQFMAYVKEIHGGTFRRIALSGLLDSLLALKRKQREKKKSMPEKIPMRRSISQTSESGDEKEVPRTSISNVSEDSVSQEGKSRKSIFKKRLKKVLLEKSLNLQTYAAASDSELLEDNKNNNTVSPSTAEDDTISTTSTGGRRRFSKFHLGWKRAAKSDHEDEAMSDPPPLDRRESKSEIQFNRSGIKGKMSFKTASHATITFLSARRRIEGGLKSLGKRMSKRGSIDDWKKNPSSMTDDPETDSLLTKEKQLVDRYLIKSGMLRFSFLLECCSPGSLPDPQLVSAMLELEAPVVARASLLLECAHFIHRCNHGDWPSWMRLNLPSFRHSASALQNRGQPSGYRRTQNLQKAAGRMFYSWAEHLGCMLEYILSKEHSNRLNILSEVRSEAKKRELRCADDDEDFLDEATVNESGSDCPYALKMMACLVLQEITTFLRETFREQKSRSPRRDTQWERNPPARRLSSLVSSPGHSQGSECNMADIPHSASGAAVGSPGANERKISFAVLGDRSDSIHSSTTSIPGADPSTHPHTPAEERKAGRHRLAQGRPKLLKHFRRGSTHNTSFRHNRSFRLMRNEGSIKRIGSIKSRKVSSQSLQSSGQAGYADDEGINDDNESVLSDDGGEEHQEPDDSTLCHNMPWVRVVVQLANLSNFVCYHQNYCHPNCYERQRRSCSRLVAAIGKVYAATEEDQESLEKMKQDLKGDFLKERFKRRESIFQQSSPTKRRESTPLLEKIKTDVSMSKLKMTTTWKKEEKPKELKEEPAILKYINSQVQKLTQCPMGILVKAAPILTEDNLGDILPVAWEVMLETDQELVASAASVFLISAVKIPERVQSLIVKELQHEETCQRINAVLRFGVLWKFRHQVWPRMEEGASSFFKLPPPNIDFTLPSPCIGLPAQTVVDPPWTPHFKAKIEVVTANQEETKSLVTATSTRRKEQQEMIRKALQAEEERKRVGRENFLMTTVSVPQLAAYEPSLHHAGDEHEEANVLTEELSLAARRVSLAPTNRANMQGRSPSWRNGSVHWGKYGFEGEEERTEHAHHVQVAQSFFPSCICATVLPILHLLDDHDVNVDGISVAEVAEKVIWQSIVDEPSLFLRYFLEKLTHKDKQEELLFMLRKMIMYYRQLPAQFAHSLFNYLIGYIMFYVRSPSYGSQDAIAGALLLMWQVIPSVEGIYFKDLKQTLKKEQCDPYILISANFPSAKKIIVHGTDQTGIPSQMPIHEDTQFEQILQESLDFFGVPENEYPSYFLVDTKSNQIHNLNSYVRDFYFFRRNFYPELSLVHMNPDHAFASLEKQAFSLKFVEIGKVLFTMAVLQSTPHHQIQNHVGFLHEEFLKLPAFPRKALEAEFGLYHGNGGNELHGLDTLHKLSWVKLMATLFYSMSDTFAWNTDLRLFLNVVNGCVILHCEDSSLLRFCLATLINTCKHFKHIFSMNGFMYVMPTLLKVYSNNQPNPMICQAIEFCCKQFYILHRKPFVLQMFGSITSLLDVGSEESGIIDCRKIQQQCVFQMLISLERDVPDNLSILELVHGEKPLLALDFCYENEPDRLEMIDVVNMCVTVIAYAPDSFRTLQMLNILEMVMPRYLEHLQIETTKRDNSAAARSEIFIISSLGTSMRALISSCEYFTRNMSVPQRQLENDAPSLKGVHSNHSPLGGTSYYDDREDSHASCRHMEEGRKRQYNQDSEDMEMRTEFRRPRDSLLCVIADFYATCKERLKELRKILQDPSFRPPELLDHKSHNRLAEIAHTLMKLAPYDPDTQTCMGLQRYMTEILPMTDWRQEAIRPGLNLILRRLDRFFNKISRKSGLRRRADWDAAANLLKGVYLTLKKFSYITHLPHLKTLICAVLSILLSGPGGSIMPDNLLSIHSSHRNEHINTSIHTPPTFCSAVIKLVAIQMAVLKDQFLLEEICGGVSSFTSHEKCINILVNLILPLSIHLGCGRRDTPKMNTMDVKFSLQVILHVLFPQASPITPGNNTKLMPGQPSANDHHHHRLSCGSASDKGFVHENEMLLKAAYLGLEILMMCYDKVLAGDWHKVTTAIQVLGAKVKVSLQLWKFLDFVVTHRPSIFLLLQPFIQHKMMKVNCDTAQEYYLQQTIKDKLLGYSFAHPKCQGSILLQLASELQCLKDEFHSDGIIMDERSDFPMSADQRRHASITDISVEVINPPPRPSLATIGKKASRATIFSQSSGSTGAAPFKATVLTSSMDSNSSPVLNERKDSRRISARDGHRILEKYRRPTIDDMTSSVDAATVAEEGPGLQRQPTIVFRGPALTKQSSIDEKFPAGILYENEETSAPMDGRGSLLAEGHTDSPDLDPRAHRLQRLNEKSRKTFKRKSKMKAASIRRYPNRHHDDVSDGERASAESSPTHDPHGSPPRYRRGSPTGSARSSGRWDHTSHHRGYSFHHQSRAEHEMRHLQQVRKAFNAGNKDPQGIARSVETIPESMEMKPSRPRYIQRSRSHDDPYGDYQASSGTARGRIARQGAKIVKSRSPSTSPIRVGTSPTASPTRGQAYVTQYDSNESLDEYSALLKDEVKVHKASDTSRLCYDEQDLSDTLV